MQLQSNVDFSDSSSSPDNTVNASKLTDLVNTATFSTGIEVADLEQSLKTALGLNSDNVLEVNQSDLSSALQTALGLDSTGTGGTDGTITEAMLSTSLLALLRIVKDTTTTPTTYTPENSKVVNVDPANYQWTIPTDQQASVTVPTGTKGVWYHWKFWGDLLLPDYIHHVDLLSTGNQTYSLFEMEVNAGPYTLGRPFTLTGGGYAPVHSTNLTIKHFFTRPSGSTAHYPSAVDNNFYVQFRALNQ